MKILITGGSGLLGKSLAETKPKDTVLILTCLRNIYGITTDDTWYKMDVRNRSDVSEIFQRVQPDAVIHCAAVGSVDYTESHYDEVAEVNFVGTQYVVDTANEYKTRMIYISSNAVFGGDHPPYDEQSPLEPANLYGNIKKRAERYVMDIADRWLIIRPFLLYGWPYQGGRTNWAATIIDRWQNSDTLKMVNDCVWMPTYAPDCAEAIWKLLFQENNEIYNVASPERLTLYEFGLKVCEVFELDKNILEPVPSSYFKSMARRPVDTTYDLVKLSQAGIIMLDAKTGLEEMRDKNV